MLRKSILRVVKVLLASAVPGMVLIGCGSNPVLCLDLPLFAVTVEVRDAVSGENLSAGAKGVVFEGEYVDSLQDVNYTAGPARLGAANYRPGTYSIRVEHPGYATWSRSGLKARASDSCGGVEPVDLVALLEGE